MWQQARGVVSEVFFKDTIALYENIVTADDLGEELETQQLVGRYPCNIENSQNTYNHVATGKSVPQSIRISLAKATPLVYSKTYKIKIESARLVYDANEVWNVTGWVEGQISTVISAEREVAI